MNDGNNIRKKFFGLNKNDVDEHISQLKKNQTQSIEELQKELQLLKKQKSEANEQLKRAKEEEIQYEDIVEQKPASSSELVSNAYKRIEKTVALIGMLADEEAEQMAEKAKEKLKKYDAIIEELQNDIEGNKEKIEAMLKEVSSLLKSNVGNILSNNKEKEEKGIDYKKELARKKSVLDLFDEKEQEKENILKKYSNEKITADGTSLNGIKSLLKFKNKFKIEDGDTKEDITSVFIDKKVKFPSDDFDDINFDFERDNDDFDDIHGFESASGDRQGQENWEMIDGEPDEENNDEIKKMRNAIIFGKLAGEDVVDASNNVIIPKGKVLEQADIDLAEKEGKLAELIINMVLPT